MRKHLFTQGLRAISCAVLFCSLQMYASTTTWKDGDTISSDVVDKDLIIKGGKVKLDGGVHIKAKSEDVLVTVQGNATVKGTKSGPSRLYLEPEKNKKITFCLNHNLRFEGSSGGKDLLILVRGEGTVVVQLRGGERLTLGQNDSKGGTKMYLAMDDNGNVPTLCFERKPGETSEQKDEDVWVIVEKKSLLSYIAEDRVGESKEKGCIKWDPANTGTGRMVLKIEDKGGVVVRGNKVDDIDRKELKLSDINRKIHTGKNAQFKVVNSRSSENHAGLLVVNRNNTLFDLLADPWCNLGARKDKKDFNGSFSGVQWGFVLGANATLEVQDDAYLDYVGTRNNVCPSAELTDMDAIALKRVVKERNPSALVVDGNNNPKAKPARVVLQNRSAVVLRSGVDKNGDVRGLDDPFPFTIDPSKRTSGAGEIVLAIEGVLNVVGSGTNPQANPTKLEILSLDVDPTGGSVLINGAQANFPLRSFARDVSNKLRRYNNASFFVNNNTNLTNTWFVHTDTNHNVVEKSDTKSEPAYVGGDTAVLKKLAKPQINLFNTVLMVQSDVAFTGLDVRVPNGVSTQGVCEDNNSRFIFFHNGKEVDEGTGRQMVLGTSVGSTACDGCTVICKDAHLDVVQTSPCTLENVITHRLTLLNGANNDTIVEEISGDISNQFSVHTIYLGHASNISVGSQVLGNNSFDLATNPELLIDGNFYSFETRGGLCNSPETSNVTGKGGMFVDTKGKVSIASKRRASVSMMITKSGNGVVDLPKSQVFFDARVGVADWQLDLSDANARTIVEDGQCVSDYTLNWPATKKDFANFCPYEVGCFDPCQCPAVEAKNVTNLPTVRGVVDQLQIKGSRLGDAAHVMVDCGRVRELVYLSGTRSGAAPVGVVVLQNNGRVGLGSAHRNADSVGASVVLGVNGVTLIANGDGRVDVNEDLVINNVCHVLAGPDFGSSRLTFHSNTSRTLTVKSGGVLDLSSFTSSDQEVEFAGDITLVLEPGAQVILNGGTMHVSDAANIVCEPLVDCDVPAGSSLTSTDDVRVKFVGTGKIVFNGNASMTVNKGAFVGVETLPGCSINTTNLTVELKDNAQFSVGDSSATLGGAFQVGNTSKFEGASVSFSLLIDGPNACFRINSQGFVGLGVGMADKTSDLPNNWLVDATWDVAAVNINVNNGKFIHDRIFSGDNASASLFAIGPSRGAGATYTFDFKGVVDAVSTNISQSTIRGGGNFVNVTPDSGAINPTVLDDDGVITSRLSVGILASKPVLLADTFTSGSASDLFNFWKTKDIDAGLASDDRANAAASNNRNEVLVGYVDGTNIGRQAITNIVGNGGITTTHDHALDIGALVAFLTDGDAPRSISSAFELL